VQSQILQEVIVRSMSDSEIAGVQDSTAHLMREAHRLCTEMPLPWEEREETPFDRWCSKEARDQSGGFPWEDKEDWPF